MTPGQVPNATNDAAVAAETGSRPAASRAASTASATDPSRSSSPCSSPIKVHVASSLTSATLDTTLALHHLIFSGTLARFPDLKLMAVHGGGYLPGYSGRIDHAWGARQDCHADLPLPPTTYLRQVYLDTVVFSYHQLAYLIDVFGPDRIVMGTDYPFDMAEYNPIGHVAGVHGMDETMLAQIAGGNAARVLGLDV